MMRRYALPVRILLFCLCLYFPGHALLQSQNHTNLLPEREINSLRNFFYRNQIRSLASEWFDVTFYSLNLTISSDPQYLKGDVIIRGICRESGHSSLKLDLQNTMIIDSVTIDGIPILFVQDTSSFTVTLDESSNSGTELTLNVFYSGVPVPTGFGSFIYSSYGNDPWIWSLSQPYGARDWFPCKDHPGDKADSADIIITCDSLLTVGSNGRLVSITNNNDGTRTHRWQERYPIASYLISIAMGRFEQIHQSFKYGITDSMDVVHYVLPGNRQSAEENLSKTVDMLRIFSDLFGLYPFFEEKYGHVDIGMGGAMEHQTLTSTTTYAENVIAHELAHQWFGDMITCRTWRDVWLNEGFAQYSTALYLERKYNTDAYWSYMRNQMGSARHAEGSVYVQDTTQVRDLFDGNLVYAKGAVILHMLRHVLGDSIFSQTLYSYANDAEYMFRTASTQDFRTVCENESGRDLEYFFDQWVFGTGYPHYTLTWDAARSGMNDIVSVTVTQVMNNGEPAYFKMPIDITIRSDAYDTTITVFNDSIRQSFVFSVPFITRAVELDRQGWLLKDVAEQLVQNYSLSQNYPNPFNGSTLIEFQIPRRSSVQLEIFNVLGQKVATLIDDVRTMGRYSVEFDGNGLPSGVYVYRLTTPAASLLQKMLLIR
jgi:aminopeptidase N